ncbi:PREDICTED: uncharacterized protein LOC109585779 isoform X1 [Amphimedon queenslandica]|uniref:VWFD domain-containing protein n=2 Tax=Amphimedon queenslandica TaxID=400682 RepID=A0AAN0JKC1_AMPQE|nr:PREDICTED: uncharacterized protein LOC109585779 isoform X1 [Amphimedon queenslandica]|eukprot:XP_019857461.1 PREDICTED: uncharacterized protein LOC109585779 isoform X1 [Amphimedon queenslandica]
MGVVQGKNMTLAVVALFLLANLLCLSSAEQCHPKATNPCRFDCNGTEFDISQIFDYPYTIDEEYKWCPCKGCICSENGGGVGPLAAVCQSRDYAVSCGQFHNPVFILERTDPYMFTIEYTSGTTWRISMFRFMVTEEHPKPNVIFTGEVPNLQYNFQVNGKCLGQPDCKAKGPNPFH